MYVTVCYARYQGIMPSTVSDEIRSFAAKEYVQTARRQGLKQITIRVGDVHRALKLRNRVPNVSSALRSRRFLEQNQLEIESESGPPSGMGTRTTITYRLVEPPRRTARKFTLRDLYGRYKEAFASLGGGEVFLRRERGHFYDHEPWEKK
jgi:hypothetical protein